MMDEESVHVLSLKDDVGRVVAVEARELLAESGSQSMTNSWYVARHSLHQGVSITLAKMQGK